ncbi:prepilin peptidase [Lactococcus fujiensis]|uniref:prepilin peptidase n=1 Tax=Lactococcus fujiensis TaxID=610251 RepID=UPI000BDF0F67|nr:A24 family peptidase [Lactococcus fujiensis]
MLTIIIFFLGTVIGSFLKLVLDRLPRNESFIFGRSHCDNCGHLLKIWDLIPLLSQIFRLNHCHYCRVKLPLSNFIFELYFGTLALASLFNLINSGQIIMLIFSLILAKLDAEDHEFPLMLWIFFASIFLLYFWKINLQMIFWLILALLAEWYPMKIGSGDFLWLTLISFLLSFRETIVLIQVASLLGIIWILLYKKREIAFIPFLTIGYLTLLVAHQIH